MAQVMSPTLNGNFSDEVTSPVQRTARTRSPRMSPVPTGQQVTTTPQLSPANLTYSGAPRPAMSPVINPSPAFYNLADQRLAENKALSSLPPSADPGVNRARDNLITKHASFASRYAPTPTPSLQAAPPAAHSASAANMAGMYKAMMEIGGLTHEQAVDALGKPPFSSASPASMSPGGSFASSPRLSPILSSPGQPFPSPATIANEPPRTNPGSISVGPGAAQFATESRVGLGMSPGDAADSTKRDFARYTETSGQRPALNNLDGSRIQQDQIVQGADQAAANFANTPKAGPKALSLHSFPNVDSLHKPVIPTDTGTFVHQGSGQYMDEHGRVVTLDQQGKQVGQVIQRDKPQHQNIPWTPQHDAAAQRLMQLGQPPKPKPERVGSSGTQSIGSPTEQDVPRGGKILSGQGGAMMEFNGRQYGWGQHSSGQVGWIAQGSQN